MTTLKTAALAPLVEDFSTYFAAGRLASQLPPGPQYETSVRTPRQGLDDVVDAERLGFNRAFLSERWNLKEAGSVLGGAGALTSRIQLGTCVVSPATRHPLHAAAFGATMHALYGPRFVLGLGRGDASFLKSMGLHAGGYKALVDYVKIVRRLWAGETVSYEGPAGRFERLALGDRYHGTAPQVFFGTFGGPLAAKTAAAVFDGVILVPVLTPGAVRKIVARLRQECEAIGRDPDSLRICQCVVTAPDLSDGETRELAHARAVTYLQAPGYREALAGVNDWDLKVVEQLAAHQQFAGLTTENADLTFHRPQLMEPARLVPDEWMQESCAIGSVDECLASLLRFRDAGVHEFVTYGSTPAQNAGLIDAWRKRSAPPTAPGQS